MGSHDFNFEGGAYLRKICATWFVSYSYFFRKDKNHFNWKKIKTAKLRISVFNRTTEYHESWLKQIINMNDKLLNRNKINLDASVTKKLAKELLNGK